MDQPTSPDDLDGHGNKALDVWTLRGIVLAPAALPSDRGDGAPTWGAGETVGPKGPAVSA